MGDLHKLFSCLDGDCGNAVRLLLVLHRVRTRVCPHSSYYRDNSKWVEGIKIFLRRRL